MKKYYIARTRYGEHTHLTTDYNRTLCNRHARRPQQIVPGKGPRKISIVAQDHWLNDSNLCDLCKEVLRQKTVVHEIEYIHEFDSENVEWVRWWCSCGESSGTTWYGSNKQATLVVHEHLRAVEREREASNA